MSRHVAKCRICNHPDRAAIEFDFLNWRNPLDLVKGYHLRGLSTIYRHAHATGLFAKRRLNLRFAMERIVERVNEVPVTASSVIRAARVITRINDSGQWVDPPSRLIVTHEHSQDAERLEERKDGSRRRKAARLSLATSHSPLTTVFDDALLDEPSESAEYAAELPKINGKPAPPEIILTLDPALQELRNERRRAIEADRHSAADQRESSCSGGFTPPVSPGPGEAEGTAPTAPEKQTFGVSSTSLPQAASLNSASSALTDLSSRDSQAARSEQTVAAPSSTLPEASPDQPATAKQSPRAAGPQLGSSASADPPFPFIPRVPLKWKVRRRFLIENDMHSRGESND
ncbi:MAG TPA: hypothetical protein VE077_05640 [Candidatus Methylomirabilis sp.]|nr:hypothetical protein [Candidatus Methylomirabilis sp.]